MTGFKVTFMNSPAMPGATTITLKVQDTGSPALSSRISFTLRVDDPVSTVNPPSLGMLPNRALQLPASGGTTYTTKFVIGDLNSQDIEDVNDIGTGNFMFFSTDATIVNPSAIILTPVAAHGWFAPLQAQRSYILTAPTGSAPGITTVTVELHDNDMPTANYTTTSFVVQTVANSDAAPTFGSSSDGTFLVYEAPTPSPAPQYHYTVISNDSTSVGDLRVTAKSSNTNLVSNDLTKLNCSTPDPMTGEGTVTIIPNLPLPLPRSPFPAQPAFTSWTRVKGSTAAIHF
jgi:hypothetical protein